MNIYFNTTNKYSTAMFRIERVLKRYAPDWVTFVDNHKNADLQLQHVIGRKDFEKVKVNKYIPLFYCYNDLHYDKDDTWNTFFENAVFVYSYYSDEYVRVNNNIDHLSLPLGCDPEVFKPQDIKKDIDVITTGYVSVSEKINDALLAAYSLKQKAVHIGGNLIDELGFDFREAYAPNVTHLEKISDIEFRNMFQRTRYVSAIRFPEGFELPAIEALFSGARPICADIECYRRWFGEHALYVDNTSDISEQIKSILSNDPKPVNEKERDHLISIFSWEAFADGIWNKVNVTMN